MQEKKINWLIKNAEGKVIERNDDFVLVKTNTGIAKVDKFGKVTHEK